MISEDVKKEADECRAKYGESRKTLVSDLVNVMNKWVKTFPATDADESCKLTLLALGALAEVGGVYAAGTEALRKDTVRSTIVCLGSMSNMFVHSFEHEVELINGNEDGAAGAAIN